MKRFAILTWLVVGSVLQAGPGQLQGQLTPEGRAEVVLKLLPEAARSDATVILRSESGDHVYRQGDGPFVCVSDTSPADRISMVCHHRELEDRLQFERRLRADTGLQGAQFRERLCREVDGSDLAIPAGAMEITANLPLGSEGDYSHSMTVYHLLWTPGHTTATLGVSDEDPGEGRPFLHQAGTCGAHVMWSEDVTLG